MTELRGNQKHHCSTHETMKGPARCKPVEKVLKCIFSILSLGCFEKPEKYKPTSRYESSLQSSIFFTSVQLISLYCLMAVLQRVPS